jgi:multiple sugar transport system substrate-binding protein
MTSVSRRTALGLMAGASTTMFAPAIARAQAVEISVHYSMPAIFKPAQDAVMAEFAKRFPNIKATYTNPTPTYEDGAQLLLRGAATRNLPDVSFQGLNRLRLFAERNIAIDLRPLLAAEGDPVIRPRSSASASTAASRPACPSRPRTRSRTTTSTCSVAPG